MYGAHALILADLARLGGLLLAGDELGSLRDNRASRLVLPEGAQIDVRALEALNFRHSQHLLTACSFVWLLFGRVQLETYWLVH